MAWQMGKLVEIELPNRRQRNLVSNHHGHPVFFVHPTEDVTKRCIDFMFCSEGPPRRRVLPLHGGGRAPNVQEAPHVQVEHPRASDSVERRIRHEVHQRSPSRAAAVRRSEEGEEGRRRHAVQLRLGRGVPERAGRRGRGPHRPEHFRGERRPRSEVYCGA